MEVTLSEQSVAAIVHGLLEGIGVKQLKPSTVLVQAESEVVARNLAQRPVAEQRQYIAGIEASLRRQGRGLRGRQYASGK